MGELPDLGVDVGDIQYVDIQSLYPRVVEDE